MALTTSTTIPREGGRNGKDSRHAPPSNSSGILGPVPWTTLPLDSSAKEASQKREKKREKERLSRTTSWGRFDYKGEAKMYENGDVHISLQPRSNVSALHGPMEEDARDLAVVQPGQPSKGMMKIGQGLVRSESSQAMKQPLSQALPNAGVYQAQHWATTYQDIGAFKPFLKWARSQGEWDYDRRLAEIAMKPDLD
jgi:hypothetical protein